MTAATEAWEAHARARCARWTKRELDAGEAGWDYVIDMYFGDPDGLLDFDGSCEARDMADALVRSYDSGWRGPRDKEVAADYVYDGMRAAVRWLQKEHGTDT